MAQVKQGERNQMLQLLSLLLTALSVSISLKLVTLPTSRLIENRYCVLHYLDHDPSVIKADGSVEESLCKIDAIQKRLGWMSGMLETTTLACDIVSTAPLAYAADRLGQRRVLLLNLLAMISNILWLIVTVNPSVSDSIILLGPLITTFGGGFSVSTSILLAITSSIATSDSERPIFISWFNSAQFSSSLLGPSLAALLMVTSLWLPLWTASAILLLPLCVLHILPDSKKEDTGFKRRLSNEVTESTSLVDVDSTKLSRDRNGDNTTYLASASGFAREYWSLVTAENAFGLVLISFFLTGVASSSSLLFPLFLTKRFGWTFAEVGVIYSFKAIVNLTMSLVVVPYYSSHNTNKTQMESDQLACRLTLAISAIGAIMVAVASSRWMAIFSLCVYAVGSVVSTFMYSISRSVGFDEHNQSKGYALIVLAHELGRLIATPAMTLVWASVIRNSTLQGTPFIISAAAYLLCLLTMTSVR